MTNELYHYGMPRRSGRYPYGSGERPYQRSRGNGIDPVEDTTLWKGTRLNSISNIKKSSRYKATGRPIYTYNPEDSWDTKVYEGPFSLYAGSRVGKMYVYRHQFEVVSDLKMPTKEQRVDEFKNLFKDDTVKDDVVKEVKAVQNNMIANGFDDALLGGKLKTLDVDNIKSKQDWDLAYRVFGVAMEAAHLNKSTKRYLEVMSSKYDAMVDDNNQGFYNEAHDPVIIFNAQRALRTIGRDSAKKIKLKEYRENRNYVERELAKKGKSLLY